LKTRELLASILRAVRREVVAVWGSEAVRAPTGRGAWGDVAYRLDLVAEEAALKAIRQAFGPDVLVVSEEAGLIGADTSRLVLLDPIDGSTNAVHGVPLFNCCLAVAEGHHFSDIVGAGVIDLARGDLWVADEYGAEFNGAPARPSGVVRAERALVAVNARIVGGRRVERWVTALLKALRYPRFFGTTALEIAWVASGQLDAYIDARCRSRPFDFAPAAYILKAAGGYVETFGGRLEGIDFTEKRRYGVLAASTPELAEELKQIIAEG
jgi:myo-inositol-1(or 4)-monophosphatase